MIRYRKGAYTVTVYVGRDPFSGKEKRVSRSLRMPEQKRTPAEVKALEGKLLAEVAAGSHKANAVTVSELLDLFLQASKQDLSPTTYRGYEGTVRLYLKPGLGDVRLPRLTPAHLETLYRKLLFAGRAPSTVHQAHAIMRRALRFAERFGWVTRNVANLADPPKVTHTPVAAATDEQIEKLVANASADLADLIQLAASTGCRRGELCGLRWSDLSGNDAIIQRAMVDVGGTLSLRLPKSGRVRRIRLGPKLLARLEARRERLEVRATKFATALVPEAYVLSEYPDGSKPLAPNVATDRIATLAKRLELPVHLHMLRHYAATTALSKGAAVNSVAAFLGHTSAKMTLDVYGHAIPSGVDQVGDLLDG